MQKFLKLITKINKKECLDLLKIVLSFLPGIILKILKPDIWLFSERSDEARDNGFWMFDYTLKNGLHKNSYYTIALNSPDLKKITNYKKNIIKYSSFKHFTYLWACSKYISAHVDDGYPSPRVCYKLKMFGIYRFKYIFLQHGVVHNYHEFYDQKNTHADKIICSSLIEKNFLIKKCNYTENSAKCVGLARFDGLLNNSLDKINQILVIPTWRRHLANISKNEFQNSEFYKNFYNFLTNQKLLCFIKKNKILIKFFLHKELQKFSTCFENLEKFNIKILNYKDYDVQTELKKSALLITDYSSVAFDFAYMDRPLIYFQFDYDEFRQKHTKFGYFDYKTDGFGKVCHAPIEIVDSIITICENNFKNDLIYSNKNFFLYHDNQNCIRNFDIINYC